MPVIPPSGTPQSLQYYLSLITSEYQNSPKFLSFVLDLITYLDDVGACAQDFINQFDLDAAVGVQLDLLGTIVGVSRTVNFQPSGGVSPILDDDTYRLVLRAKIVQNSWDGKINSLQAYWKSWFPGGEVIVLDGQNMSITVILAGVFTSIQKDLILNGYIVPRPETVLINYVFATLPIFGFDGDGTFISGFDTGHWS